MAVQRLVERGRYEELVKLGGVFAELDAQGCFVPDAEPRAADAAADLAAAAVADSE